MKILDDEKDKLLDHEYDGIRELDNHMPLWWLWLFYFTIAFGVGYLTYYYVLGGPNQHEEYEMEMAAAMEKYGDPTDKLPAVDASLSWAYSDDPDELARGKEIFMGTGNLCFTCHGSAAEGLVGPNLTDSMWLHGCSAEEVATSIINGYPDKGMVAYGSGAPMPTEDVQALVSYIGSLQGSNPANAKPVDAARAVECSIE